MIVPAKSAAAKQINNYMVNTTIKYNIIKKRSRKETGSIPRKPKHPEYIAEAERLLNELLDSQLKLIPLRFVMKRFREIAILIQIRIQANLRTFFCAESVFIFKISPIRDLLNLN